MVLFLSDNGMSMPFCKANCYLNSTKSPYLVRWPDAVRPGTEIDALVASIDYMPTILEIAGIEKPEGMDGTSLCPLLTGTKQEQYDDIYTTFFKTAKNEVTKAERHYPMRCVQTRQYAYIYNAWSSRPCGRRPKPTPRWPDGWSSTSSGCRRSSTTTKRTPTPCIT